MELRRRLPIPIELFNLDLNFDDDFKLDVCFYGDEGIRSRDGFSTKFEPNVEPSFWYIPVSSPFQDYEPSTDYESYSDKNSEFEFDLLDEMTTDESDFDDGDVKMKDKTIRIKRRSKKNKKQKHCCIAGCHRKSTNRLARSLKIMKKCRNGGSRICNKCYFGDLYEWKKLNKKKKVGLKK